MTPHCKINENRWQQEAVIWEAPQSCTPRDTSRVITPFRPRPLETMIPDEENSPGQRRGSPVTPQVTAAWQTQSCLVVLVAVITYKVSKSNSTRRLLTKTCVPAPPLPPPWELDLNSSLRLQQLPPAPRPPPPTGGQALTARGRHTPLEPAPTGCSDPAHPRSRWRERTCCRLPAGGVQLSRF